MYLLSAKDSITGGVTYALGDTIAVLITGEFQFYRLLGMLMLGSTLYAIEIPAYFRWLDQRYQRSGLVNAVKRMGMTVAFFNPLWIARHLLFIKLFAGYWESISWALLTIASYSFVSCLVVALPLNYLIQNCMPLTWRFFASSVFSGLLAIYFSLSEVLFG